MVRLGVASDPPLRSQLRQNQVSVLEGLAETLQQRIQDGIHKVVVIFLGQEYPDETVSFDRDERVSETTKVWIHLKDVFDVSKHFRVLILFLRNPASKKKHVQVIVKILIGEFFAKK